MKKIISILGVNVLRIACLPGKSKEIAPTFAVPNSQDFKNVKTSKSQKWETFENSIWKIKIKQDGKHFSPENLQISWPNGKWKPGKIDKGNLGGPFYSLDNVREEIIEKGIQKYDPLKGYDSYSTEPNNLVAIIKRKLKEKVQSPSDETIYKEYCNCIQGKQSGILEEWDKEILSTLKQIQKYPPGLLSKSGVTIFLDDSSPWDQKNDWIKVTDEEKPQILYCVFYGNDFKNGLGNLTKILGSIPKLPSWVFGVWFSCYRKMGEKEFVKLKKDFDENNLPLDVVVVDTDWHKLPWHGFDWNTRMFPDPGRFANWLKSEKLKGVFNVHPAFIPQKDSRLPEFKKKTGSGEKSLDPVDSPHQLHDHHYPIDLFDKKETEEYFEIFHKPIEKQGCDLWWVDGHFPDHKGRNTNSWMNHLYAKYGKSGLGKNNGFTFSRGFGLGVHRSTLHFTGDTFSQWKVLEQEVIMTSRAANSLHAYVSHDIGGFFKGSHLWKQNKPPDDLFIRWVQFGVFSPVMRFHSDHGIREPWRFKKETLEIIRNFLNLRKKMKSYLMKLVKEAHETGVSLCRPMYYEFPEAEEAFKFEKQYMLGDSILVSPIVAEDSITETWIPEGEWEHLFLERTLVGPTVIKECSELDLFPIYLKKGFSF